MWRIIDSGPAAGALHMDADRSALTELVDSPQTSPTLRFFQWDKPTVSYGYLLDPVEVRKWAESIDQGPSSIDYAKRPTGGGAVFHPVTDLNFSLLWRRGQNLFSETPRTCYAEIHALAVKAVQPFFSGSLDLFAKPAANCAQVTGAQPSKRFSACFEEPVCNDVMWNGKKILGGALRLTKQAVLYQGTLSNTNPADLSQIKTRLGESFQSVFLQSAGL